MFAERQGQGRQSGERSPVSERGDRSRFGGGVELPGMEDVLMSNRSSTTSTVAATPAMTPALSAMAKPDLVMFEETEVIDDVEEVADEVEFHVPPAPSAATPGAGTVVRAASPVSIRRETFESDRMVQEEQHYQTHEREGGVYPGVAVVEEETHLQSPHPSISTQQYPPPPPHHHHQEQEQEQYPQEYHQHDTDMETDKHDMHAPSSSASTNVPLGAVSREVAPSSAVMDDGEATQPETSHPAPEATSSAPVVATAVASTSAAAVSGISLAITNKALDSGKKTRDSKERHDALKAQEDAKIEELKKTIADLQRQEQDIIRSLRGMGTPSEIISRHIHQLHEYNDIKDVGQVILGKCAELEGTTIKKQYENFGLDMDD
ncbi:swi5-like zinc finger protein [Linnemannia gamsii]|uniref:Swi5-like zinc finger protein n=1 Tax=Linnemannia gamsii TaxID=64522 RepID=A0ABQ7JT35_9FUNG|nr:swi5-like zinc finger protein [Linnemannia gamsii]